MVEINNGNIPYNPIYQNSNSYVNDLLEAGGITPVLPTSTNGETVWAPAFDNDLLYEIPNSGNYFVDLALDWGRQALKYGREVFDDIQDTIANFLTGVTQSIGDFFTDIENDYNLSLRPNLDPLIVDLGPNGVQLKSMDDADVYFDMDNDGLKERTGWLTAEDGFVAIDENGNGIIDNVGELIGDPGQSGFAELATYDSNGDGQINSSDAVWNSLRIWRDLDEDGETDAGELQTLSANGIASFGLDFTTVNFTSQENLIHEQGSYTTTGGQNRLLIDVWMQTDSVNIFQDPDAVVSQAAAALPNIRGYGSLPNLQVAMTSNANLLNLVQQFMSLGTNQFAQVDGLIEFILIEWADAGSIDPVSRGGYFDARKLAVLEALTGTPWVQQGTTNSNPPSWAAANLESAWNTAIQEYAARFLTVGPLSTAFEGTLYAPAADVVLGLQPFGDYVEAVGKLAPISDPRDNADFWAKAVDALRLIGASNGVSSNAVQTQISDALREVGLQDFANNLASNIVDLRTDGRTNLSLTQQGVYQLANLGVTASLSAYQGALLGGTGNDFLIAAGSQVTLAGGRGSDVLFGSSGSNHLDGGSGADLMRGGDGNDTYFVDHKGDVVVEDDPQYGGSEDQVRSWIDYVLGAGLENLSLQGRKNLNGTGNDHDNILSGNKGANILRGGKGNDTYYVDASDQIIEKGGEGRDEVFSEGDFNLQEHLEDLTLTGTGDFKATGNDQSNTITGNAGDNIIDGRGGNDYMYGGAGDDAYVVDSNSDYVNEYNNQGTDTVYSSVDYSLGSYVERLVLTGTADIDGSGNSQANYIRGNAGNNTLRGYDGADILEGREGDDTYRAVEVDDTIIEQLDGGLDRLETSLTNFVLPDHVEILDYTGYSSSGFTGVGNASDNWIYGSSSNDTLTGLDGNDRLFGGAGADVMTGGRGNDYYQIDNAGDVVNENPGEGVDTIDTNTSIFTLPDAIENVILQNNGQYDVNGNAGVNILTGNNYANVLDGQLGADLMFGGGGSDTFIVDNAGDRVVEYNSSGEDLIKSYVNHALGSNVENLTLLGSTATRLRGNNLDNELIGNSRANIFAPMAGQNRMTGGNGSDLFLITSLDTQEDNITDFTPGTGGDLISLSGVLNAAGYNGADPFGDNVLRYNDAFGGVQIEYNRNWMTADTSTSWISIVQLDGVALSALNLTANINLNSVFNSAPVLLPSSTDLVLMPGQSFFTSIADEFVIDFESLALSWQVKSALPDWLAFNETAQIMYGSPETRNQPLQVVMEARDGQGLSTELQLTLWTPKASESLVEGGIHDDFLEATRGASLIVGGTGNDEIIGSHEVDRIVGGPGNDVINAGGGDDLIYGGDGRDYISGGADRDTIFGGDRGDFLFGNRGQDFIAPGGGADQIDGGSDFDRVWYGDSPGGVTVNLATGLGSGGDADSDSYVAIERVTGSAFADQIIGDDIGNSLKGGAGDDHVSGGGGRDTIEGNSGRDELYGGASNDLVLGGADNDKLFGNRGVDRLDGGLGNDQLTGGSDIDYFVFKTEGSSGFGTDFVLDFQNGADRLDVRGVYSTSNSALTANSFDKFTVTDTASGAKIKFETGQVIYLSNIAAADLDAGDFLFA